MKGASAESAPTADAPLVVDRYAIYDAIASGGMATVHLGRLIGTAGFLRTVAIKRLHSQFAHDPEFTAMFLDEARLASRIQHPNVVSTLDVVMKDEELLLVMEYVRGESLSRLVRRARDSGERLPPRVAVAIVAGALHGLHAAHEAVDEKGQPMGLVHRDMSPQNVLVGTDGVARVLDFGVAKAAGRVHTTKDGDIKGKVLYMAPEQLAAQPLDCTADVYAAGVVLFETLTCVRMFAGENEGAALTKIIQNDIKVPSEIEPSLDHFDAIVRRATAASPATRYPTALAMAVELEAVCAPASPSEVSAWVQKLASEILDERARMVSEIERSSTRSKPPLNPDSGVMKLAAPHIVLPDAAAPVLPVAAPAARPHSMTLVGLGLLGALLLVCIVVIGVLLGRGPGAATTNASAAPSASESPVVTAPVVTAPLVVKAEPAPVVEAPVTRRPAASAAPAAQPQPHAGGRVNCDPPYVVDKNGHQHFLPECMK
ncbi:MAG TPA: serine/threonine-protein kinase [Labilithrix sp.]|nr:serine/threonine-protein kinase [Labilithrix sp.]